MNRTPNELGATKFQGKGVPKFIAPLRKSLLCNPHTKVRPAASEGLQLSQAAKKSLKVAVKVFSGLTADERATVLLMKTSGLAVGVEPVSKGLAGCSRHSRRRRHLCP
jgi:hypothetical protein